MSDSSRNASSLTCLFWNIHGRNRCDLISSLVEEKQADVVILAEHTSESDQMLEALKQIEPSFFQPPSNTPRLQLFARNSELDLDEIYADVSGRVSIRPLRYQATEFLLATGHLPSKVNWTREDQTAEAQVLSDQIRREESHRRHARTILVGDFNMNPFEDGIVSAAGLHAMMTRSTVSTGSRTVQGREYPFFYNPMWGFFGDRTDGPPGTHFYRHSGHVSFDWNIFDQVLVRPDVLPWFRDDIEILTKIGETELKQANGRPDAEIGSDHFPIVFRLATIN